MTPNSDISRPDAPALRAGQRDKLRSVKNGAVTSRLIILFSTVWIDLFEIPTRNLLEYFRTFPEALTSSFHPSSLPD